MLSGVPIVVDFQLYSTVQNFVSVFLCCLRFTLCPTMYSILEKVSFDAEKNVYSLVFRT